MYPQIFITKTNRLAKTALNKNSEFLVKEEKVLNYVLAALLLALFGYGVIDAIGRKLSDIDYQSYIFFLAIFPAIYCFRRAHSQRVYIRINKKGIYQDERLVTDWAGFLKAYITQKKKSLYTIQDHFVMVVEYRKPGTTQGLRRVIPVKNTQNRSQEDVLPAVHFFWKESKKY